MADIWLYTHPGNKAFAYSPDRTTYYTLNPSKAWAWVSDSWLYAYDGGKPIGYFSDGWVYSQQGQPLYYTG